MKAKFVKHLRFEVGTFDLWELDEPYKGHRKIVVETATTTNWGEYDQRIRAGSPSGEVLLSIRIFSNDFKAAFLRAIGYVERKTRPRHRCSHCAMGMRGGHLIASSYYCDECKDQLFRACADCGNYGHSWNMHACGGRSICNSCFRRSYQSCSGCGNAFQQNTLTMNRCEPCLARHIARYGPIHSYDSREYMKLGTFGNPKNGVYFGVELEVACMPRRKVASLARKVEKRVKGFCILKSDSSTGNDDRFQQGFEIVSAPASLEVLAEKFLWLKEDPVQGIVSYQTRSCGMHVHVSRKPLTPLTVGKMLLFLNDHRNEALVSAVAGRTSNSYCERRPKKLTDGNKKGSSRYDTLNTRGSDTIEFRLFRGTLSYEGFMKNLEFIQALLDWAPLAPLSMPPQGFLEHVREGRKSYPNLFNMLARKGFIVTKARIPEELVCA